MASASPPTTVEVGEATTESATSEIPRMDSSDSTCWPGISTDAMAPLPEMRFINRDARQMTRTPSSTDSAPATTAAADSPSECPMTAPGRTPWDFIVSASATCIAKIVGWTRSMPVTSSGADIASVTEKPDSSAISGSIPAIVAAKTGSVASSSAPIPGHCEPCPENTHTGPRSPWPTAGSYGKSLSATSRRALLSSPKSLAETTVRTGRCARRRDSV